MLYRPSNPAATVTFPVGPGVRSFPLSEQTIAVHRKIMLDPLRLFPESQPMSS